METTPNFEHKMKVSTVLPPETSRNSTQVWGGLVVCVCLLVCLLFHGEGKHRSDYSREGVCIISDYQSKHTEVKKNAI